MLDTAAVEQHAAEIIDWLEQTRNEGSKHGLLLVGGVGCGKTSMLTAVCRMMTRLHYSSLSTERKGFEFRTAYGVAVLQTQNPEEYERFKRAEWIAIDDIGQEPAEVQQFGNILNPIRDLLLYRYENDLLTIASTNQMPKALTTRYGERIGDRLREMMHVIQYKEASYRGRNVNK